jgi:hypothetical protein
VERELDRRADPPRRLADARASAPSSPPPEALPTDPRRRRSAEPAVCREDCKRLVACWCCGRCADHCVLVRAGMPDNLADKAAHDEHWRLWQPVVKVKRRRR